MYLICLSPLGNNDDPDYRPTRHQYLPYYLVSTLEKALSKDYIKSIATDELIEDIGSWEVVEGIGWEIWHFRRLIKSNGRGMIGKGFWIGIFEINLDDFTKSAISMF